MPRIQDRKHSATYLARRIVGEVWEHPNNRGRRVRAVVGSLVWQGRKRLPGSPAVRTVYGDMRIWMDPAFGSVSNIVYFGEDFDLDEMTFLRRYLRPGDTFLDIGANIGAYSLLGASLVGRGGKVHAFEPAPTLVAALRRNVELNDLAATVEVHELAVTDHEGELRFRADRDVSSRIASDRDPDDRTTVVRCGRLDDVLPEGPIAVAKMDVEGAEFSALRGFLEHLGEASPPVLILEVLSNQLALLGTTVEDVVGLLECAGYELTSYSAGDTALGTVGSGELRGNVLAVASSRRAEVEQRLREGGAIAR